MDSPSDTEKLYDAHCHLSWFADPRAAARDLERMGVDALCATVDPADYERAKKFLRGCANVDVAAGLHPWWVAEGRVDARDVKRAVEHAYTARFVGEIGLDFGKRFVQFSQKPQLDAFTQICEAASAGSYSNAKKTLTIHSVRSAGQVLEILEATGCVDSCRCIMHWFSGTSDELRRAIEDGCFFSIGERMLSTRRGREYARQIPEGRFLLETDLPPEPNWQCPAEELRRSLEFTRGALGQIRPGAGPRGRLRV